MNSNDRINEFLAAVAELRGDDDTVRTTAHTSSVSANGWKAPRTSTGTAD